MRKEAVQFGNVITWEETPLKGQQVKGLFARVVGQNDRDPFKRGYLKQIPNRRKKFLIEDMRPLLRFIHEWSPCLPDFSQAITRAGVALCVTGNFDWKDPTTRGQWSQATIHQVSLLTNFKPHWLISRDLDQQVRHHHPLTKLTLRFFSPQITFPPHHRKSNENRHIASESRQQSKCRYVTLSGKKVDG